MKNNLSTIEKNEIQATTLFDLTTVNTFESVIERATISNRLTNLSQWNTPRLIYLASRYTDGASVVKFAEKFYGFGKSKTYDNILIGQFVKENGTNSVFQNEDGNDFENIYTLYNIIVFERAIVNKDIAKLSRKELVKKAVEYYGDKNITSKSLTKEKEKELKNYLIVKAIISIVTAKLMEDILTYDMSVKSVKDLYKGKDLTNDTATDTDDTTTDTDDTTTDTDDTATDTDDTANTQLSLQDILNKTLTLCNQNGYTLADFVNYYNQFNK